MKIRINNGRITSPNDAWWSVALTDNSPPWPLQIDNTPPPPGGTFTPLVGARFALVAERGMVG